MSKFKYHEPLEELGLCTCLAPLILFEINLGNRIISYAKKWQLVKERKSFDWVVISNPFKRS